MADSDVPSMGKIYEACQSAHEKVKDFAAPALGLTAAKRNVVKSLVRTRWDMLTTDIHCAGYVLEPEHVHHNVTSNKVRTCVKQFFWSQSSALKANALQLHLLTRASLAYAGGDGGIPQHPGKGVSR